MSGAVAVPVGRREISRGDFAPNSECMLPDFTVSARIRARKRLKLRNESLQGVLGKLAGSVYGDTTVFLDQDVLGQAPKDRTNVFAAGELHDQSHLHCMGDCRLVLTSIYSITAT